MFRFKEYFASKIEVLKMEVVEKFAKTAGDSVLGLLLILIFISFLFFMNITIALLIGDYFGSYVKGFVLVSGFYLFIFLLFLIFGKKIIAKPITNEIIKRTFDKNENNEEK